MTINHRALCKDRWDKIKKTARVSCLELNISEACNYRCEYCIFHRNISKNALMNPQYAKQVTEEYIRYLDGEPAIIYLGAGEPLLNWEAIVQVNEVLKANKNHIELRFMTNASLLTRKRLQYIHENHIGVGFSLDGPPVQQNKSRVAPPGVDSFGTVERALEWAKEIGYPVFSLSATYKEPGFSESAEFVMNLCKEYHIPEFDLDYDIASLLEETMDAVADALIECYLAADAAGLRMFGYWMIPYLNSRTNGGLKNYCDNSLGNSICISAGGNVKLCCYDPKTYAQFTDFETLFDDPEYRSDIKQYTLREDACLKCELFPYCFGQCVFLKDQSVRNRNCAFMKTIFNKLKALEK